ncbi:ImmA/IrrE family metallo-endopeptidase [Microbacterium sp. ISL-59]|uniref:XRE family transcriptional regulator n=1 Tax=Microbacterium sp. ISL-59 TaxID=2819159 RepID=UPI001BE81CA4|nr:XRE family transcriptional regulator [Microbacterium sp. ISL-59]MBT2496212.1 ImmA/IrrE family metallo-endopeptidase [Microbacterium sp. ISL-59]
MPQPPRSVMQAARVMHGWTQTDLGKAAGLSQWTVSQIESREQPPEPAVVDAIAAALAIPRELMAQPDPSPRILHAFKASLPRTARNLFLASVTMAHAHVSLLARTTLTGVLRDPDGYTHPHDFAERLRRRWLLPAGPINKLLPELEAHGIICIYRDLTAITSNAVLSSSEGGQYLMFLDSSASKTDLAWAIAHELGHLTFVDELSEEPERDADMFAAGFLMPGRDVRDDDTLRPDLDLASAADRWGVRPRVLAQRLRDLKTITDLQFRDLVRQTRTLPEAAGRRSLLATPTLLADSVKGVGGSRSAASRALLTVQDLRKDYLARSGG